MVEYIKIALIVLVCASTFVYLDIKANQRK
jgi:hypothetical protein